MHRLPIESILPELKEILQGRKNAVLIAEPGAGKTTRVPLALLHEPWLEGRRILMLEPRRLAARAAAGYMANLVGEQPGKTVGYRVKLDAKVGPATRIEVITEGILTRMIQEDPGLEGVALVIFDEFHERSLHADLGLALCLQSQELIREDLRILVMSATLDGESVSALLGDAPVLTSKGRVFPVETRYLDKPNSVPVEQALLPIIIQALQKDTGDLLVFLPGAKEIRRMEEELRKQDLGVPIKIAPLYGNLSREEQDWAIAPALPGERKVVLSTSIAETSLTVEGIQIVIDSGFMRVPRFSPKTGMSRLETIPVSKDSAEQRKGRAGRLGPGVCYRLWTEEEHRQLPEYNKAEMLEADLSPFALELAVWWGVSGPSELKWLDPPPSASYSEGKNLLIQLEVIDDVGKITSHGRRMAEMGIHPRLAHMILKAIPLGLGQLACQLAALLQNRDIFRGGFGFENADLRLRIESLPTHSQGKAVLLEANTLMAKLGISESKRVTTDDCGLLLAFAYPDRIAQARGNNRFLLRNGRRAVLTPTQPLSKETYLVVAETDGKVPDSRIFMAAPIKESEFLLYFRDQMEEDIQLSWDSMGQAVRGGKRLMLGAICFKEETYVHPDPEETLEALIAGIRKEGLGILPWNRAARQWQQRLIFMHHHVEGWPAMSDDILLATIEEWLGPFLYGLKSKDDLQQLKLGEILAGLLTWEQKQDLEKLAPTHCLVPSGSRIPINYSDPDSPVLPVKIQEMFGLQNTPCIGKGNIPLTLHLLSPAQRPVQITKDLASFWEKTYFEIKKDLKGRYPKHYWPDDPIQAQATNRIQPKK